MRNKLNMLRLTLVAVVALSLTACDASEQNLSWEPGNSLSIVGPLRANSTTPISGAVQLPLDPDNPDNDTVYFYVLGFNSSKTYTWTFNGQTTPSLQGGEFTSVELPVSMEAGTYAIEVSNGTHTGRREITIVK